MTLAHVIVVRPALIAAGLLALAGCTVDRTTGERTLTSSAAGAAGGAVAGLFYGNALESAAVGAAAGAASGFVYDQIDKAR